MRNRESERDERERKWEGLVARITYHNLILPFDSDKELLKKKKKFEAI